jgi:hypothetical protein
MHPVLVRVGTLTSNGDLSARRRLRSGAVLVLLPLMLVSTGCANVHVSVRNDTGAEVRIARCVDDSADVEAGDTFTAEGVPQHNELSCRVTHNNGSQLCVSIPTVSNTYSLSRAIRASRMSC